MFMLLCNETTQFVLNYGTAISLLLGDRKEGRFIKAQEISRMLEGHSLWAELLANTLMMLQSCHFSSSTQTPSATDSFVASESEYQWYPSILLVCFHLDITSEIQRKQRLHSKLPEQAFCGRGFQCDIWFIHRNLKAQVHLYYIFHLQHLFCVFSIKCNYISFCFFFFTPLWPSGSALSSILDAYHKRSLDTRISNKTVTTVFEGSLLSRSWFI